MNPTLIIIFVFDSAALHGRLCCLLDGICSFNLFRHFFEMTSGKFDAVAFCTPCKFEHKWMAELYIVDYGYY